MARQTKAQQTERAAAIAQLREWLKPGDTVYTILDHVSSSGMSRAIRVVVPYTREDGTIDHLHPNWAVGKALDLRHWKRHGQERDALVVGGCGMDMGFHLVYELSHVLYGAHLHADVYLQSARTLNKDGTGPLLTREGAPEGKVWVGGYVCLGKGKCPSNYHVNHRDTIHCEGSVVYNPDGPNTGTPCTYMSTLGYWSQDEETPCAVCKGKGRIANPEGPERFDLVHTDGYALRHRWL